MRRIVELDALRGITAFVIVCAHLNLLGHSPWIPTLVDLFFVISGYFITRNLLEASHSPRFFRVFYTRRALRIWPAYYLAFVACMIINRYLKWDNPPHGWLYFLTFTQNIPDYWGGKMPVFSGMFQHTWTMAIEEQFYLFWPVMVYVAGRRGLPAILAPFLIAPVVMRALGWSPYLLLTRCDSLSLGGVLAYLATSPTWLERRRTSMAVAMIGLGVAALAWPVTFLPGQPLQCSLFELRACLIYFAVVSLVFLFAGRPWLAILRNRVLCYTGEISYGLYLYHPMVFAALPAIYKRFIWRKMGLHSQVMMDLSLMAVCFLVAILSRELLEKPILALKNRFRYDRASASGWRRDSGADEPTVPQPHSLGAAPTSVPEKSALSG
jgi:peptidoglycan/LPS O-acetylase OafA/YrhL